MKPQLALFMTDIQLKKLVNEAVSLHRALTTYSERLKALKADLIREAQRHKEDFMLTDGGRLALDCFWNRRLHRAR